MHLNSLFPNNITNILGSNRLTAAIVLLQISLSLPYIMATTHHLAAPATKVTCFVIKLFFVQYSKQVWWIVQVAGRLTRKQPPHSQVWLVPSRTARKGDFVQNKHSSIILCPALPTCSGHIYYSFTLYKTDLTRRYVQETHQQTRCKNKKEPDQVY